MLSCNGYADVLGLVIKIVCDPDVLINRTKPLLDIFFWFVLFLKWEKL